MMARKLVLAGIIIIGVGLALIGYLDPVIRILFFGQGGLGARVTVNSGATSITRTGGFGGNVTAAASSLAGRGALGGTPMIDLATILVFAATVIGLLLTVAGVFAAGKQAPKKGGPAPAA